MFIHVNVILDEINECPNPKQSLKKRCKVQIMLVLNSFSWPPLPPNVVKELVLSTFALPCGIHIDYVIESATYGFLFTSCKTLENSLVRCAHSFVFQSFATHFLCFNLFIVYIARISPIPWISLSMAQNGFCFVKRAREPKTYARPPAYVLKLLNIVIT